MLKVFETKKLFVLLTEPVTILFVIRENDRLII